MMCHDRRRRGIRACGFLLVCLAAAGLAAPAGAQPEAFSLTPELTAQAIFSCRDLTISGNSAVSSEGVAKASTEEGHVRSNADIRLNGAVEVHGDAIAGPGAQVIQNGAPALVTGEITNAEEALDCNPVDLAALQAELEGANDNDALPRTDKGKKPLGGADGRAFSVKGNDGITLPAGTYLFSSLSLTGNSGIRVNGSVRILVTGDVDVQGDVNAGGDPYALRIWSATDAADGVSLTSGALVHAFLYAPDAGVRLAGQSTLRGGIYAGQVDLVGGSRVIRAIDDVPPAIEITSPQEGDSVEVCEVTVTGTVSDDQTGVTLTINGEAVEVDDDGGFAAAVSLYTDDPGLIEAAVTDLAGNTTTVRVRVEIVLPVVALTTPAPGSLVGDRIVDLSGTSGTAVEVTVNDMAAVVGGGAFTLEGFDLGGDGLKTLEIVGTNCGGTGTATAVLDLDTTPPAVAIDAPTAGDLFGASPITVTGTVEDAHLATVAVNGVAATVASNRFTAEGVTLEEGDNELVAVAVDALGLTTSSAPVAVELDTTAPTVAIDAPASGSIVDTPAIAVEGAVSDPNLDTVTVNGVAATVAGMRFSAADVPLAEGDNSLVATAVDQVGNRADSPAVAVVLDTLAPEIAIDGDALTRLTAAAAVTVSGTVADPHLDTVTVNGVAATVSGGTWAAEVPLEEGANPVTAVAVDTLGHRAETPPEEVVRDSTPPEIAITEPVPGAEFDTRTVTVRGTVIDAHLEAVTVEGVAAAVSGSTFEATVELPEGDSEIDARAVDVLGQATNAVPVPVTVDTLPPVVAIDVPPEALVAAETVTVTGTFVEPHLDRITVAGIEALISGDTFTVADVPLVEGPNPLTAIASDTFGHDTTSAPVTWTRDTTPPEVAIAAPADGTILDPPVIVVSGTVADLHLAAVTVNGVAATVEEGSFTAEVTLTEGGNVLVATAVDQVDNSADSAPVTVVLDTQPPEVAIDPASVPELTDAAAVTVAGTVADAHLESVTVNGVAATVANGAFTAADVPLAAEGPNALVATAVDVLGHSTASAPVTVVRDTLAPEIAIETPVDGTIVTSLGVDVEGPVSDAHLASVTVNGVEAAVAGGRFAVTVPVADGANTLTVTATDELGHSAAAVVTVFLDTLPPAVTLDLPDVDAEGCLAAGVPVTLGGRFTDPNPATGQDGQPPAVAVEVRPAGGGAAVSYTGTLAADARSWTAAGVDLGAADGIAAATVIGTDVIGNVARVSRTWRVDAGTPELALTLDGAPFPGAAAGAAPPAGAQPTLFARRLAAGATVVDGATFAPPDAVLTLDGQPYAAGTPITAEGDHLLVATVTDCAGHGATVHAFFRVDLSGPALVATDPADGAVMAEGITAYSGTSDADLATAMVNGAAANVSNGSFSRSPYPWVEGDNEVTIELTDQAGNSTVHRRTFTVRSLDLSLEIVESGLPIADGQVFLRPVTPLIRVSDPDAEVTATLDGAPFTSGTEIAVNGSHTLAATASGALGRTATAGVSFEVDVAADPRLEITSPGDGTTVAGTVVTVTGTVTGDGPAVRVNGVAAVVTGESWTAAGVPLEPDAPNELRAEAVDRRGRRDAHQVTVLAVASGPQIVILEPADGTVTNRRRIDVAGAVAGGSRRTADGTVTVTGTAGVPVTGVPVATDGTFRALDVPLAEGDNVLTAESTDPQGFLSQAGVTVAADFAAPLIALSANDRPLEEGAVFSRAFTLRVEVTDEVGAVAAVAVRLNGSLEAQTPVSEILIEAGGGYVVSVVARDAAGNESRLERAFLLDLGGCALTDLDPPAGASVSAPVVTIRGRSGSASSVLVRVPDAGGGFQEFTANLADGTFLAGDVPLRDVGTNALEIVCVDPAGDTHVQDHPLERLAPSGGPSIRIDSPVSGDLVDLDFIAVAGTTSAGIASVNGVVADVVAGTPQNAFTAAAVPLVEGPNVLGARAVDAGGQSSTDRVVISRDSAAPKVQITSPDDGTRVGLGAGAAVIDVSGLVDVHTEPHLKRVVVDSLAGSVVATVDLATGAFLAADVPLGVLVPAGEPQTLTVQATDELNHLSTASVDVIFDPEGPAIVLHDPPDLSRYTESSPAEITVTGEAWAAAGAAITLNGGQLDPADLAWGDLDGLGRLHTAFSATVPLPSTDGAFGVIARVTDLDERHAQARRLLQKDSLAPEVIEMVPADGAESVDPNSILLVLFSEPVLHASLAAADGLTLERLSTGDVVVGTSTVAGNAVGFAPGAGLAPGELYRFRAGLQVTDVDGHPLAAPSAVTFRVADEPTAAPPVLDPLPAVVCADELFVTGTAAPNALVKVRDGSLTFSDFADTAGAFSVRVPVTSNGYHLLHVFTVDATGALVSPEATAVVRVDCSAPVVRDAAFDRAAGVVTVTFSEEVDPATVALGGPGDAVLLTDAEDPAALRSGTISFPESTVMEILLDAADPWWVDRPVRLEVRAPAADLEGNAMLAPFSVVFFPGGAGGLAGGFLFGEAYDDASGRPLEAVSVRLYSSSQALPGTVPEASAGVPFDAATSEGRGRFTMAAQPPAGRYVILYERDGYTRVVRRLALEPAVGAVPFDARLTPLAAAASVVAPATGGRLELAGTHYALEADPGALPGNDALAVHVTPLSGQGLPDFLPLGWTPAVAAEVRLLAGGEALPENGGSAFSAAGVRLELPLPAWVLSSDELAAVRYDLATGLWTTLAAPERLAGPAGEPLARLYLAGPGAVAVVLADEDPATRPVVPAFAGEPLAGSPLPSPIPALAAELDLDPPTVPPTGRSRARVVARSADGSSPWPAGLAVQAFLEEKLILAAGAGELLEAPFSADLVLYHPRLTGEEQSGNTAGSAGAVEFVVSPSPRAAQVLLEVGFENIRLFPFPEQVERGPVLGPAGGSVGSPASGVELIVPEGALPAQTPVEAQLLSAAELAALPPVAGYETLAAVRVQFQGRTLARSATLKLDAPAGTPAAVAGDPRVILAELVDQPSDFRGAFARLAARTERQAGPGGEGERIVATPDLNGILPLAGIVREGVYLVLAAQGPIGFATGFVRGPNDIVLENSRVTTAGLGTADVTGIGGRYSVVVPAGADRVLTALHPLLGETGSATIASLAPGQEVLVDIAIEPVPPAIVSVFPADGAVDQPVGTPVSILFSEALDSSSVVGSTLRLELADADGQGTGAVVLGATSLAADGFTVVFSSQLPLPPGRRFLATFNGGVRDAGGTYYDGPSPVTWLFTTSTVVVPGGQVDAGKFHVRVPVGGVAEIFADPGALPLAQSGQAPWSVSPFVAVTRPGEAADPERATYPAAGDGSFSANLGHPPEFPVTVESQVWVTILDPAGQIAAEFQVGPMTTTDGKGFVAPAGEAVTFESIEGNVIEVPAGAFDKATLVKIANLPPSSLGVPTPEGMSLGAYVDVDFEGKANETLTVRVPAPAAAAAAAQVFIGTPTDLPWGRRLRILSVGGVVERDGERYLSNDESVQPDFESASLATFSEQGLATKALSTNFKRSLLIEFTARQSAAFFYEAGVLYTIMLGGSQPFPFYLGAGLEAIFNKLADIWVYVPDPVDWGGFFVLPVIVDEPVTVVRRDISTGWILHEQAYDPVQGDGDLIAIPPLGNGEDLAPPMLIDASPFQLHRFEAPEPFDVMPLRIEIEAEADASRKVRLGPVPEFPLPNHTSIGVWDLSPLTPKPPPEGAPPTGTKPKPEPPKEGPEVHVCDDADSWQSNLFEGTSDMLLVVAPGDLDANEIDSFEFQFDRSLVDISELAAEQVATLEDLGPSDGCSLVSDAGFPKKIPVLVALAAVRSRLVVAPVGTLPSGHRFRLELEPEALRVEDELGGQEAYWATAPRRFEFATRAVPGEVLGSVDDQEFPFGGVGSARDILKLGNLIMVATDAAKIVAVDVTDHSDLGDFKVRAVKNGFNFSRTLATDGHNRVFYTSLVGTLWTVNTLRMEDVRKADAECSGQPDWAAEFPCFDGVKGTVRLAYATGSLASTLTASEWLTTSGGLPSGTPIEFEVLTQDEQGATLELEDFYETYAGGELDALTPDDEGIYTFNLTLSSTFIRAENGELEPSAPDDAPPPSIPAWRDRSCIFTDEDGNQFGEEDYDRYQRVTIDNLTTGQSWSFDVENPWPTDPDANGDGTLAVAGLKARRGDQLRVRYNVRALGYAAIQGSGISVVDLNRFYRLVLPLPSFQGGQCGRRLGVYEGQSVQFPECATVFDTPPDGIAMTPSVAVHSATGCDTGFCRGEGYIDVYSPLIRIGAVHTKSDVNNPGAIGQLAGLEGQSAHELAACIEFIDGDFAWLRDVALANDVSWIDTGVRGTSLEGPFQSPPFDFEPSLQQHRDLLFLSMGMAGIYVFDVTARRIGPFTLVGHLKVEDHAALLFEVDPVRGLLFAGGVDFSSSPSKPLIDVWDISTINVAPGTVSEPRPLISIHAPWQANHLGIDQSGTGLIYSWGHGVGPVAVPFENPEFVFSGLYLPEEDASEPPPADGRPSSIQRITARFVPLGVPMETLLEDEELDADDNERDGTAAFKVRIALPGSFGDEITAKVQSLRVLPDERYLGQEEIGAAVAMPGGPGWPDNEVVVTLRRVGFGADETGTVPAEVIDGEAGRFATVYNLYESEETILAIADPRARREYTPQDVADGSVDGSETADEKAQCRRCDYPSYLPDPENLPPNDPELGRVKELLAGRYVRAFLFASPESPLDVRSRTEAAIAFFERQGENYRLPSGYARMAAPADAVPSPLQVALAEPAQTPATWVPNEAGVSVSLTGGEALLNTTDHRITGRGVPMSFERTYRSGMLGYGPLGSAGWDYNIYSHLREIETTGEVEYHDGQGHVWRFFPISLAEDEVPEDYEGDPAGSYYAAEGVYLRLQKLSGGQGWRLLGRSHDFARYDVDGRLIEASDRYRRGKDSGEQGNTIIYRYDPYRQLVEIEDDLSRNYRLEYYDDPAPVTDGGDGDLYGLLKKVTDFVGRTIEYEYADNRTLEKVKLPEVENPVAAYAEFSYEGDQRPTVRYEYDPSAGVTTSETDTTAILHGKYAELRLESCFQPNFVAGGNQPPRVRFQYDSRTGRIGGVSFPDANGQNSSTAGVEWQIDYPGINSTAAPAESLTVRAPWGHGVDYTLEKGRTTKTEEDLEVTPPAGSPSMQKVTRSYTYAEDGRITSITQPDGGRQVNCYPDGAGSEVAGDSEGCGQGGDVDRLALANVVKTLREATTPGGQGSADYTRISSDMSYQEDNLISKLIDGLGRSVDLPAPVVNQQAQMSFGSEGVTGQYGYDQYGRLEEFQGGGPGGPTLRMKFGDDADGNGKAGLVKRFEQGSEGNAKFWRELEYDDAYNVMEERTSYGTLTRTTHDDWDRVVRTVTGLSEDGRFSAVGTAECTEAEGSVAEMAYDAAGHMIRERKLQDFVNADGQVDCRWVETRYEYNAREQVIAVHQTHLASPDTPGEVIDASQMTEEREYDTFGRLAVQKALNLRDPALTTVYRYDDAGRIAGIRVGDAGEEVSGYDENSRVVRKTDGDQGEWRGRYDAWDRLYHEERPTGAVVRRQFDQANYPSRETIWDADPLAVPEAKVLSDVRSHFNSFGEADKIVTSLISDPDSGETEIRVAERIFDESGRVTAVYSGPPIPNTDSLDADQARREVEPQYELDAGRVLVESYGGDFGGPALYARRYFYDSENKSPWADEMDFLESIPGEPDLVETYSTRYTRDALGRPITESRSDGSLMHTTYDRTAGAIRIRTGAGTQMSVGFDGRGLPVRHFRPNNRGETTYSYDFDGRMKRQVATNSSADAWEMVYSYDSTQRVAEIDHEDGTSESFTYNPDNTVATHVTRQGIEITFSYDAANRMLSAVPAATAPLPPTLAPLDGGDFFDYDELSRITEARRGTAGEIPALTVVFPSYDLESRPASEIVGSREPLARRYDTWDRPVEVTLPAGVGRSPSAGFAGFRRDYDTLDRISDVGALGGQISATTLGATWAWGGADRLFGVTTKGPLGTAARYGYIAGRGPQPPGVPPDDEASQWRLGTLSWGSAAGSDPVAAATQAPATVWGQFAFGWRGNDGDPRDGAKQGREAVAGPPGGLDLFAGLGWSWNYDAGVRLNYATTGRGDAQGRAPPSEADSFRFEYGQGDELEKIIRESEGSIADLTLGAEGRVTHRNGLPFAYDAVGRRTEDDRFNYLWNWRGELVAVSVKELWPPGQDGEPEASPFAGQQIRYEYDALGRLNARWHLGRLPAGVTDDAERPFIEKRVYVWEGSGLLAEAAYGDAAQTQLRWRKTYVPGASGYIDATQVAVEVVNLPGSPYPGNRLYTYLRDELGTVVGVVAEDEGSDADRPPVPVRYLYTPYGEAFAETGPRLRRVRFDNGVRTVETAAGTVEQTVSDPSAIAGGALRVSLSLPVTAASLNSGVIVERLTPGGWQAVDAAGIAIASGTAEPSDVLVMLRDGWKRGASFRVRLESLEDASGRPFEDGGEALEWSVPLPTADLPEPAVIFEQRFSTIYETYQASGNTVGGRFPGGQTCLFHGQWTDPVTGIAYARSRWYDPRNATWLSEDPVTDADSPNLYAFVGWQPNMATDPSGEVALVDNVVGGLVSVAVGWGMSKLCQAVADDEEADKKCEYTLKDAAVDFGLGFATSGLSSLGKLKYVDELGTAAKWALRVGAEVALDTAAEVTRREWKGEEYDTDELVRGAALGVAIGEAASLGAKAFKKLRGGVKLSKYADDVAEAGSKQARRHGDEVLEAGGSVCRLAKCFAGATLVLSSEGLVPIEEVEVGDRVITTGESQEAQTAVDATWKVVRLRMEAAEDLELELLRSPEWLAAMGAAEGQKIWLDLPELEVAGHGVIEAIEPSPAIGCGPGQVVLSTISVRSDNLVEVWLKGLAEPLEATADHPVYSVTRGMWLGAGDLLAGEEIRAQDGVAVVLEVSVHPGRQRVFNLEVEQDHVFLVTDLQVLSHNAGAGCGSTALIRDSLPTLPKSFEDAFEGPVRLRTFKAGEKVYRSPWVPKELPGKPGAWLGTRRTVTKVGTESQANIRKWGNPVEVLRTFEFTQDVTVYYGKVAGGKGYQALIPDDINPGDVLRFIKEVALK